MSHGTFCNFAEVISEDAVAKTCPDEISALLNAVDEADTTMDEVATEVETTFRTEAEPDVAEAVVKTLKALQAAYLAATGVRLLLRYHTTEDAYDEVDGYFWELEHSDLYQLTPAGEKLKGKFERKFFTTAG